MTKRRLATFLSLISVFGGHVMAKRWDRVVQIAAVLVVSVPLAYYLPYIVTGGSKEIDTAWIAWRLSYIFPAVVVIVSALLSAALTYFEYGQEKETNTRATAVSAWALSLVGLVSFVALPFYAYKAATYSPPGFASADGEYISLDGDEGSADLSFINQYNFQHYLRFAGDPPEWSSKEEPPSGSESIRIQFVFQGEPAEGVTAKLTLNGKYRTALKTSDDDGIVEFPIESGTWFINTLSTESWAEKPRGEDFVAVSGHEQGYKVPYVPAFDNKPLVVDTDARPSDDVDLVVQIRPALEVPWPTETVPHRASEIASDAIYWQTERDDAVLFAVNISEVREEGNTIHYTPFQHHGVRDRTRLPLKDLAWEDAPGETYEYQVEVFAFDGQGNLLTQSSSRGGPNSSKKFKIEGQRLVKTYGTDWPRASGQSNTTEDGFDWMENTEVLQRVSAVKVLIEEDLLREADTLLERLPGDKMEPGRKTALLGYINAKQGLCWEAERLFKVAKQENPKICISDCYKSECDIQLDQ